MTVNVLWFFLKVPWVGLQFVIVVFPDHTHFILVQIGFLYSKEKTCLRGFTNSTGADQPAHPRSLISAFVIRFLRPYYM